MSKMHYWSRWSKDPSTGKRAWKVVGKKNSEKTLRIFGYFDDEDEADRKILELERTQKTDP